MSCFVCTLLFQVSAIVADSGFDCRCGFGCQSMDLSDSGSDVNDGVVVSVAASYRAKLVPPKSSNVLSGSDNDNDVELSESGSDNDDDVELSESGPPPKLVKLSSAPTTRDPIETFLFVMYKQQKNGCWNQSKQITQ